MTGVLVTGGTGKTGSALVDLLRSRRGVRGNAVRVRVASRNPSAGDPDSVRFDWEDPATHPTALRGMDRVFLVPPVNVVDPMPLVGPFLAEAQRIGVRRLVLLGSAIVLPNAPGPLELADRVRARPGWVVLRASGFMQNFLRPHPLGERIRRHGEIRTAAGAGRLGWIDARDIAAAAAALLTHSGVETAVDTGAGTSVDTGVGAGVGTSLGTGVGTGVDAGDRRDYLLTGPKALSYGDAAAIITARTGRPIRVRHIGSDELAASYRAVGLPAEFAAALAAVEDGIRAGREDLVSTAVLDLTGRPPRPFTKFVQDHAPEWSSPARVQALGGRPPTAAE